MTYRLGNEEYKENEMLLVEVESTCDNLCVGSKLLRAGKSRLEILAQEIPLFLPLVETEKKALEEAERLAKADIEEIQGSNIPEIQKKGDIAVARHKNSPQQYFRKAVRRDPKPLRALSVVERLGMKATEKTKLDAQLESNAQLQEMFRKFLEMQVAEKNKK